MGTDNNLACVSCVLWPTSLMMASAVVRWGSHLRVDIPWRLPLTTSALAAAAAAASAASAAATHNVVSMPHGVACCAVGCCRFSHLKVDPLILVPGDYGHHEA